MARKRLFPRSSTNRILGITSAKRKIAFTTGIPTTKQGRQRKCRRTILNLIAPIVILAFILSNPIAIIIVTLMFIFYISNTH